MIWNPQCWRPTMEHSNRPLAGYFGVLRENRPIRPTYCRYEATAGGTAKVRLRAIRIDELAGEPRRDA